MNDSYIMGCYGCKYLNGEHCKGTILCLGHANYTKKVEVKEMKKTFKEVIADIKEGEVWEGKLFLIKIVNGTTRIETKEYEFNLGDYALMFDDTKEFTLQRKKVTFTEAFAAYEEGKEIESCYTDYKYKKIDGVDHYMNDISVSWYEESEFQIDEIRGEWYINA